LSNSSTGPEPAKRAQWLAEVSASLAEASAILFDLDLAGYDRDLIADLYLQIEAARADARQLSAGRRAELGQHSIFGWCGSDPWDLNNAIDGSRRDIVQRASLGPA
jgi:hypothetical protein